VPGLNRSRTYWWISLSRARMLIRERCRLSARTAKMASRISSLMLGRPLLGRSHRPSTQPAIPTARHPAASRFSVRSLTCPSPSSRASSPPSASSSATLARRRCPSVVRRGSYSARGSPSAARRGSPLRNPVSTSSR
jgi:hypothetical protein